MAGSLYGTVFYHQDSYAGLLYSREEIVSGSGQYLEATSRVSGVAITLYNAATNKGITVSTRADGSFQINDIPNGTYKLIETFGAIVQYQGTGSASFKNAVTMTTQPPAQDPTVEYISQSGLVTNNATRIVSLSPNVAQYTFTNTNSFYSHEFYDAPRILIPLQMREYTTTGSNLIKSVDAGTFGLVEQGTSAGTSNETCPYGVYNSGNYTSTSYDTQIYSNYIKYSSTTPNGGYFTICNIANLHTFERRWFDTPGKTQGDETGRFLIVNGNNSGRYFFKETVSVQRGKDYLFTAWIMNIYRIYTGGLPLFKIIVQNTAGTLLFSNDVSADNPLNVTKIPTWKQIGVIIPASAIGNSTQLIVQFISMGNETLGNDYCVDDISFLELEKSDLMPSLIKSVNKIQAQENENIEYTLTLFNGTSSYINALLLIDPLPYGTSLAYGTMNIVVSTVRFTTTINAESLSFGINISQLIMNQVSSNLTQYASDPYISDLKQGRIPHKVSVMIKYSIFVANASVLSDDKVVRNSGRYEYESPLDIDNLVPRVVLSNEVCTTIQSPKITYVKQVSIFKNNQEQILNNGDPILCGQLVAYRIVITNSGLSVANNIQIIDTLDNTSLTPIYSQSSNCSNGISVQSISPVLGNEVFLPCSSIEKIGGSIYNIRILNITVPAATIQNTTLIHGQCVVRIYCRINCN